jgi:hypothetical protein
LVQEIETMVNDRLAAAAASLSLPDPQMTAIMALLNMAEEIALLRKSVDRESDWSQRLASLVAQLDCVAAGSR